MPLFWNFIYFFICICIFFWPWWIGDDKNHSDDDYGDGNDGDGNDGDDNADIDGDDAWMTGDKVNSHGWWWE